MAESADLLRQAAALMRKLASAATPSGEQPFGWSGAVGFNGSPMLFGGPTQDGYRTGTVFRFAEESECESCERPSEGDLYHIRAWHPAVALAVADWLDTGANPYACVDREPMLAVARAFLGQPAEVPS